MLETQGVSSLYKYLLRIRESGKKSDLRLFRDPRIRQAFLLTKRLWEDGEEHPKFKKLVGIVKEVLKENEKNRIIVFANYRDTVEKIREILTSNSVKAKILIGQKRKGKGGLTQKEQIEILEMFRRLEFNVLVGTSITEEGLSIPDVNCVIFFDAVPSEIRSIQRRGRTGRTSPGRVIFLITKGTSDEAFYWASFHREKKMKGIVYGMKMEEDIVTLDKWLK